MNVIEIMEIFKIYLIGKVVFIVDIVDTWAETPCSSGFRGGKMFLVGGKMAIWAEKA